ALRVGERQRAMGAFLDDDAGVLLAVARRHQPGHERRRDLLARLQDRLDQLLALHGRADVRQVGTDRLAAAVDPVAGEAARPPGVEEDALAGGGVALALHQKVAPRRDVIRPGWWRVTNLLGTQRHQR